MTAEKLRKNEDIKIEKRIENGFLILKIEKFSVIATIKTDN